MRRDLVGIGLSDSDNYATRLAEKFDYTNTFFHADPRLDIASAPQELTGRFDFIIASDVFEHVAPPVSRAFANARRLLKPNGVLIFSVPYSLEPDTREHFPELSEYRVEEIDGAWRLENRTADGRVQVFTDLIFHGGPGSTLEMRLFSRAGLEREFAHAGFARVRVADEMYLPYGIVWPESWSVPMVGYAAPLGFPPGHFYSPVADVADLRAQRERIWPAHPAVLGIDFNDAYHQRVLREYFPAFYPDFAYPARPDGNPLAFYLDNDQFSWLDCRALFVLLRAWRPKRLVEVGSGFSTLLIADVNRRFLGGALGITCIEPYPRPFLHSPELGLARLLVQKVQDADARIFSELDAGDVLFIDSSHVAKTGSDVNHLCFEVLPRLRPGVRIHFHDIFLPTDYPQQWVLDENRSWNEQYLVRALLMFSSHFRVLFGCSHAFAAHAPALREALGEPDGGYYGGGSLWIEKVA